MPEQLRDQLDNPHLYTDAADSGNKAVHAKALEVIENARPITATQDHEPIAYDVAHAIKPEIDYVASLEQQKKDHNPLETAAAIGEDGKGGYIGVKPFDREVNLVAAKADLERNAKKAAEIATNQHLGGAALAMAQSRQKVADMRHS